MVVSQPPKLTVEEFDKLHGNESNVELVRGQVVRYPMAGARHGLVNIKAAVALYSFVEANKLGRVMSHDTFIRISPETVRGADLCFMSYARLPATEQVPEGVLEVSPELVVEVRSPSDLWTEILAKAEEYVQAGVAIVVILDPKTETASVIRPGTKQETFEKSQTLTIPDVLPGFAVPVSQFFAG
jgi:Uma2 family endonuclease